MLLVPGSIESVNKASSISDSNGAADSRLSADAANLSESFWDNDKEQTPPKYYRTYLPLNNSRIDRTARLGSPFRPAFASAWWDPPIFRYLRPRPDGNPTEALPPARMEPVMKGLYISVAPAADVKHYDAQLTR
jgi:hypothetical protein